MATLSFLPKVRSSIQGILEHLVLIIDDSESMRKRVVTIIADAGVEAKTITAASGAEALAVMAENRVSLVLCDIEMPGLDGFHFLRLKRSRPEFADIPVIMLTVREDPRAKVQGLTEGASDYLTKPFFDEELVARVRVHLKLKTLQDELRNKNARLEEMSRTDALTDLSNRRHFVELLESELARSMRYAPPLSLLMVDIDNFKRVNDEFGHLVGDRALVHVAGALKSLLRKCDYAARYGGEEFALVLPQTDAAGALVVAERCRIAVEAMRFPMPWGRDEGPPITVSLGVASYPDPRIKSAEDLMRMADDALYASKRAGRNRVTVA
ncbi:MAG: diguanylate cyclase [Polyangiaceae bacterium]|nr:diguanylate cyclase [Polyangiaceae bacterium]